MRAGDVRMTQAINGCSFGARAAANQASTNSTSTTGQVLAEIGRLIDCEVELVARSTANGMVFLIAPVDRKRLRSVYWGLVRADPCAGVWKSPEAALVGFLSRCLGWAAAARRQSPRDVERFVIEQVCVSPGGAPALQVRQAAREAGISDSALHRAAARVGVQRRKLGMRGGWVWSLSAKKETVSSGGHSDGQ
jgi:hypothetical protein